MPSSHRKHVDHCLNCGAPTPGAFCAACGQEAVDAAVTFRDQMEDFFSEVFTVESRLPQSLKLLLTRPGSLTRAYNGGQRVRYVTPLKLYLFASVAFFLVLSVSAGRGNAHFEQTGNGYNFTLSPAPASGADGAPGDPKLSPPAGDTSSTWKRPEDFDAWLKVPGHEKELPPFLYPHIRSFLQSPNGFVAALVDMISRASMLLVPIHALFLRLLYWRPRRLYGEHIVFSLHLHSFTYLLLALSTLVGIFASPAVSSAASGIVMLGALAYCVRAAQTAYAEGVVRSFLKMSIAGVGYGIALVAVLLGAMAWTFFQS